jgi:hypothetical protein
MVAGKKRMRRAHPADTGRGFFGWMAERGGYALLLATSSGTAVYAAAFISTFPVAGLALPIITLALCKTPSERFVVALAVQTALWWHVPQSIIALGVSPLTAFAATALGAVGHALLLAVLAPWASLPLWACSPVAIGHPWLGLLAMLPDGVSAGGLLGALVLTCVIGIRRFALPGAFTLSVLVIAANLWAERYVSAGAGGRENTRVLAVDTVISGPATFPVSNWQDARAAVIGALAATDHSPTAILLPEAVVSQDPVRADRFFGSFARDIGIDLLVGIDRDGTQVMRLFPGSGASGPRDVYAQVQGVPVLGDTGTEWPWRHFEQDPFFAPDGTRFRFMICYELFLPLPWLAGRLGAETVGIAASDDWGMPKSLAVARAKLIASFGDQDSILTAINNRTDHNGH